MDPDKLSGLGYFKTSGHELLFIAILIIQDV